MNIYIDKDKHFISHFECNQELENLSHNNILKTNTEVLCRRYNVAAHIKVRPYVAKTEINNIRNCECSRNDLAKMKSDSSVRSPRCKHKKRLASDISVNVSMTLG